MFHLQSAPQPAQHVPFSDWRARCQRIAAHEPRSDISMADWESPAWDALYSCGLSPAEAIFSYLED
jgi:hypothetical protein